MGTRRSKHNKGRKPFYKDFRTIAADLINRTKGRYNYRAMTRCWWQPTDEFNLSVLCESDSDIEETADVLMRSTTSVAWRARDIGLTLPKQWAQLISPKKSKKPSVVQPTLMAYPYIAKPKPENADILAINALVPRGMPESVRADVCQEIVIAILEGRTTLEKLRERKGSASYYIRRFYKDNFEDAGNALSFSIADDDRSYDEVASSLALKDWHCDQLIQQKGQMISLKTYTPATQIDAVWHDQVGRYHLNFHQIGRFLSREEVEELLEAA